jgi:hypothetical protein
VLEDSPPSLYLFAAGAAPWDIDVDVSPWPAGEPLVRIVAGRAYLREWIDEHDNDARLAAFFTR